MDQAPEESFLTHLIELRNRLIRALLAIGLVFICLFPWARDLYALLAEPLLHSLPQGGQMIATDVIGVFMVPMKVALMVAFLITLPYVLYQAWAFIAPGLYAHEKRLALPLLTASVLLFFIGMSFAYFVVFPTIFGFMAKVAPEGVAWMTDIEKYLSFVLSTFLAFGATFEVPVIVIVLVRMGFVELATLKEWRSYVIVGAFVIAAIFTPPDVVSQLLLAIPLCLLYELGLLLARFVGQPNTESRRG
ncbi:twin-arginine translocase subunit TatC [Propionivibrio limicola]|uniref:twin-arginine translocase subunit TatC n=1 Tax=Propionivibrio limicola TaxID=167645 RepID=UPI001291CFB6|nr:twin-arginine translocase subunit TatC [Propionivibrio limicola]